MKQRIPSAGPAREALREKGQFWTPYWVAEAMVAYVLAGDSDHIFDPAVGAGAFFLATRALLAGTTRKIRLLGTEIDPDVLKEGLEHGLTEEDMSSVELRDFVLHPSPARYKSIVANPPYIRHHRVPAETKGLLRNFGEQLIGRPLDGRAGYHIYFLLRALDALMPDGRLAFIMPADTCEGVFANVLWKWIVENFRLEAVITFAPEATPFPNVDTNAIVFMIRSTKPATHFWWARCSVSKDPELLQWTSSGFTGTTKTIFTHNRSIVEALDTGLSRQPLSQRHDGARLGDYVKVLRGIATGDNEFFFMTTDQARARELPEEWLKRALGRTGDVIGEEVTEESFRGLEALGRPTRLLSLDGRTADLFPASVQRYLKQGEELGLPKRSLIASRRPWYKMEVRTIPPFLFAYLGRRNARFIRNGADALPLTGFLCVYPRHNDHGFINRLWTVLRHPKTIENLALVGKSYGAGAIKVEPRALERLPIPEAVLREAGLGRVKSAEQLELDGVGAKAEENQSGSHSSEHA